MLEQVFDHYDTLIELHPAGADLATFWPISRTTVASKSPPPRRATHAAGGELRDANVIELKNRNLFTGAALGANGRLSGVCADNGDLIQSDRAGAIVAT